MKLSSENYEAMLEHLDVKEEVELNADTYFVVVNRR